MQVASPGVGRLGHGLSLTRGYRAAVEQLECLLATTPQDVGGVEALTGLPGRDRQRAVAPPAVDAWWVFALPTRTIHRSSPPAGSAARKPSGRRRPLLGRAVASEGHCWPGPRWHGRCPGWPGGATFGRDDGWGFSSGDSGPCGDQSCPRRAWTRGENPGSAGARLRKRHPCNPRPRTPGERCAVSWPGSRQALSWPRPHTTLTLIRRTDRLRTDAVHPAQPEGLPYSSNLQVPRTGGEQKSRRSENAHDHAPGVSIDWLMVSV